MTVTFTPLHPTFAAEVAPIDLRQVHDPAVLESLQRGMAQYGVLVFRDQRFTNEEQMAFAQRFDGELHARTSTAVLVKNRHGNEALSDVSNVGADGQILPRGIKGSRLELNSSATFIVVLALTVLKIK